MTTAKEVLVNARNHMATYGKAKGRYYRRSEYTNGNIKECPVCSLGAIVIANRETEDDEYGMKYPVHGFNTSPFYGEEIAQAVVLLETAIGAPNPDYIGKHVIGWSDNHSLEEVLAGFDAAIKLAEENSDG